MSRRKFLKSISSFLAAIPFVSFFNFQGGGIAGKPPSIAGVDKASPKGDYTAIMTIDDYAKIVIGSDKFYIPLYKESHVNCRCNFEWAETK